MGVGKRGVPPPCPRGEQGQGAGEGHTQVGACSKRGRALTAVEEGGGREGCFVLPSHASPRIHIDALFTCYFTLFLFIYIYFIMVITHENKNMTDRIK